MSHSALTGAPVGLSRAFANIPPAAVKHQLQRSPMSDPGFGQLVTHLTAAAGARRGQIVTHRALLC